MLVSSSILSAQSVDSPPRSHILVASQQFNLKSLPEFLYTYIVAAETKRKQPVLTSTISVKELEV